MKKRILGLVGLFLMLLPAPIFAETVYPIISFNTTLGPTENKFLLSVDEVESNNYTIIVRNNATELTLSLRQYNDSTLLKRDEILVYNFTLFTIDLSINITKFSIFGNNTSPFNIKVYLDIYEGAVSDFYGDYLILFPIDNPGIEYVTEIIEVPIIVNNTITVYTTIYTTIYETNTITHVNTIIEEVEVPVIDFLTALLIGIGGVCVLIVYIAIRVKEKREKPINRLTLDEILEDFRKG